MYRNKKCNVVTIIYVVILSNIFHNIYINNELKKLLILLSHERCIVGIIVRLISHKKMSVFFLQLTNYGYRKFIEYNDLR